MHTRTNLSSGTSANPPVLTPTTTATPTSASTGMFVTLATVAIPSLSLYLSPSLFLSVSLSLSLSLPRSLPPSSSSFSHSPPFPFLPVSLSFLLILQRFDSRWEEKAARPQCRRVHHRRVAGSGGASRRSFRRSPPSHPATSREKTLSSTSSPERGPSCDSRYRAELPEAQFWEGVSMPTVYVSRGAHPGWRWVVRLVMELAIDA